MPNDPRFCGLDERLGVVEEIVVGAGARSEKLSHRFRINTLESWKREIDEERAEFARERENIRKQREEDDAHYRKLKKTLVTALVGMLITAATLVGDGLKKLVSPTPMPATTTTQPN